MRHKSPGRNGWLYFAGYCLKNIPEGLEEAPLVEALRRMGGTELGFLQMCSKSGECRLGEVKADPVPAAAGV